MIDAVNAGQPAPVLLLPERTYETPEQIQMRIDELDYIIGEFERIGSFLDRFIEKMENFRREDQ